VYPRTEPAVLTAMADMFRRGCSVEELADIYSLSVRQVQRRLARRGLHVKRRRTAAVQLAIEVRQGQIHLLCARRTVAQMALHLGLRPRYLRLWMSRHMPSLYEVMKARAREQRAVASPTRDHDAPRPRVALTRWRRGQIGRDYRAGYSIAAIARHYGHHRTTIWRLLRLQRVPLRPRTARSPMWLRAVREG